MKADVEVRAAATHEVLNQASALVDYNLFATDGVLREALEREGAGWARSKLEEFGRLNGTSEAIRWGYLANENPPVLCSHDRFGYRIDEVEFHPAWHQVMRLSIEHGLASLPWTSNEPGGHVARAALMFIASQNEAGHTCPVSMTYAVVPALRKQPEVAGEWEPRLLTARYDPRFRPPAEKSGSLMGMAMTEKQGGSDVRANTTLAEPAGGGEYLLTGHKWFCSAPMCDAFLVLGQTLKGVTCFLLPRWLPDGSRNRFYIQRLKSKLGNRSNASSEVEFDQAWARRVGEEGRGVATIIEMVQHTRLDCVIGSAALMRQALVQAVHHARHRRVFGRMLIDQPLMQNVLADLAIESEAATVLMMRLARAFDAREGDAHERGFARLGTAVAKYWVCKRCPSHISEALECIGGNGYVEESILPRLYREAPLNSIWEGSGNVICLDILRAMSRERDALECVLAEIRLGRGSDRSFDEFADVLQKDIARSVTELEARHIAERLALALQMSLLIRHSPPEIADAFMKSRLSTARALGTLPAGTNLKAILERAY